jgi:four helix bundle protein
MNQESEKKRIQSFTDLEAWKEGHKLVILIYKGTEKFPQKEIFALTSQMRRCAVSITSNIAEGFGRQSYKEKVQFYSIAQGSLLELQNQLLIARDVGFLAPDQFMKLADQTVLASKILGGLIKKSKTYS